MRRSRQVLAIAFLATALCADRAVTAAPILRPQSLPGTFTSRLVTRLTVGFRQAVPSARVVQTRREDDAPVLRPAPPVLAMVIPTPLSPFQFRLPPPTV